MFKSTVPVKFLGTEVRNGEKNGKPWSMKEAEFFVPDLGKVKVPVYERKSPVTLPEVNTQGTLTLSPSIGKFGSLQMVWDDQTVFTPLQAVKSAVNA